METNLDVLIIVLCFLCSVLISVSGYPFLGFCLGVLDTFNNNRFDMDITEDDLYLVGDKLFVNQKGEIYIYSFPMNEYFEATDSFLNISTLPFKQYVDLMLNRTIN